MSPTRRPKLAYAAARRTGYQQIVPSSGGSLLERTIMSNEHGAQDMDLDQSISDVERVVNLLAKLDEQEGPSNEPKDSIEMRSLGVASLYEPDESDMDFLGLDTAPQGHLPSIALPSACSHQQSSVIGKHGMPVGGSEPRWRRPTSSEQTHSSAADAGSMYQNPRSRFRGPQLEGLAVAYAANPFPTTEGKAALADELQLDTRAVQVWFQNKRARERKALGPQASEHLRRRSTKDGTFPPRSLAVVQPGAEISLAEVLARAEISLAETLTLKLSLTLTLTLTTAPDPDPDPNPKPNPDPNPNPTPSPQPYPYP